jgi:hypothetical protein
MKNYSLNFQAVFDSIEELQEIFKDVLEQLENESFDEHPNCLTSTYDVEVLKWG